MNRRILAGLLAVMLGITAPAVASVHTSTYSGKLSYADDGLGLFGGASVFAGQNYQVSYDYDTSLGQFETGPFEDVLYDGNGSSPILQVRVLIDGQLLSFTPSPSSALTVLAKGQTPSEPDSISHSSFFTDFSSPNILLEININNYAVFDNIPHGFTTAIAETQFFGGPLSFGLDAFLYDLSDSSIIGQTQLRWAETGTYTRSNQPTGVPEPAALAILGLGSMGLAVRRKRTMERAARHSSAA